MLIETRSVSEKRIPRRFGCYHHLVGDAKRFCRQRRRLPAWLAASQSLDRRTNLVEIG
jgi:hypothetical protein